MDAIKSKLRTIKAYCNNEKGSSLIIALVIILILVAISMAVLTMSVGNIRLSNASREMNFSSDLQELIGQYYVSEIDEALKISEQQAQTYFRNSYFTVDADDLKAAEILAGTPSKPNLDAVKIASLKSEDEVMKKLLLSGLHTYYQQEWESKVKIPSNIAQVDNVGNTVNRVNNHMSSKLFDTYYQEAFGQVYYYFAYKNLEALRDSINTDAKKNALSTFVGENNSLTETFEIANMTMPALTLQLGNNSTESLIDRRALDESEVQILKNGLQAMCMNFQIDLSTGKHLEAVVKIKEPTTESIVQNTRRAVYGNPIWSNAITAKGTITFMPSSDCAVEGDLFSGIANGDKDSIILDSAKLSVEGNVYARGNVKLKQTSGSAKANQFEIKPRQNEGAVLNKTKIFDLQPFMLKLSNRNAFGYDKDDNNNTFRASVGGLIQTQIDIDEAGAHSEAKETKMPYVLNDSMGGNVYSRGIVVDHSAKNAQAKVLGNTVFLDDIVNDGNSSSTIELNGYVIGLDAMGLDISKFGDELQGHYELDKSDDGSCIKNFNSNQQNFIRIKAPMIFVPGRAIVRDDDNKPYATGTGVVDFTGSETYLAPYKGVSDIVASTPVDGQLTERIQHLKFGGYPVDLGEAEASKKTFIENNLAGQYIVTGKANSNVVIALESAQKKSYIAGTCLMKIGNGANARIGNNFMDVLNPNGATDYFNTYKPLYDTYMSTVGVDNNQGAALKNMYYYEYLYRIFKSKTQYLGLWDIPDIMNLVNKNAIIDPNSLTGRYKSFEETGIIGLKPEHGSTIQYNVSNMPAVKNGGAIYGTNRGKVVEGILFADGDLELSASQPTTFRGVIIANGNVKVKGNIKLIYDEQVINRLFTPSTSTLPGNANLRHIYAADFFQPGETGLSLFTQDRTTKSARGRKLVISDRLELEKWIIKK